MMIYTASRSNFNVIPGEDILSISSNSDRRVRVVEILLNGMGAISSPIEIAIIRADANASTSFGGESFRNLEPEGEVLANSFANWDWDIEPTLISTLFNMSLNADGGVAQWKSSDRPGDSPIQIDRAGEVLSLRAVSGSGPMSALVMVEEWNN